MAKAIGTLGTIPSLTVGGQVFTDLTTIIYTHGYTNSNTRTSLGKDGSASGYQVTSGKTYTIQAVRVQSVNGASATATENLSTLAYADNDVGKDSATAFTNPVYQSGGAAVYLYSVSNITTSPINEFGGQSFGVAATKYVSAISNAGGLIVSGWGYEA